MVNKERLFTELRQKSKHRRSKSNEEEKEKRRSKNDILIKQNEYTDHCDDIEFSVQELVAFPKIKYENSEKLIATATEVGTTNNLHGPGILNVSVYVSNVSYSPLPTS